MLHPSGHLSPQGQDLATALQRDAKGLHLGRWLEPAERLGALAQRLVRDLLPHDRPVGPHPEEDRPPAPVEEAAKGLQGGAQLGRRALELEGEALALRHEPLELVQLHAAGSVGLEGGTHRSRDTRDRRRMKRPSRGSPLTCFEFSALILTKP